MMSYKSIFTPFSTRPKIQDKGNYTIAAGLQLNFKFQTWLLIGATLQAAISCISHSKYVLLLSGTMLSIKLAQTILQTLEILPNPYMQDVIPGRTTALMPGPDGEMEASSRKIAVLHLGAKSNHPLGMFAPQFASVGGWLSKMGSELEQGQHQGFLGQTSFTRADERGAMEVMLVSYWDSVEDLWAFAHSGTHRECWQWWEKTIKLNNAVGINHEIFEADAKHWENIYVNFQPTMQGATTFVRQGNKIEAGVVSKEWVSPLVDARRGKLAKSSGRLGRDITIFDETRVAKETYA